MRTPKPCASFWETKVDFFVGGTANLFGSEYAFDSTGFESTQAIAHYAVKQAADPKAHVGYTKAQALSFMEKPDEGEYLLSRLGLNLLTTTTAATIGQAVATTTRYRIWRRWGGGGVLDYALYFATDPYPLLRLAYASILSSWALMNTGTPESNYGYWFPGAANDGGAGGGFEPAAFQLHVAGPAKPSRIMVLLLRNQPRLLRRAAQRGDTILADDPYFGTMGIWRSTKA